jgi:hypothetical protein
MRLKGRMLLSALWFALAASAFAQVPSKVDSLVLERTLCFGTCPAYRLRVARDGSIIFQSHNPGDSTRAVDQASTETLDRLIAAAVEADFFTLPPRIQSDRELCSTTATDHPGVTITFFAASPVTVDYYTGCYIRSSDSTNANPSRRFTLHPRLVRLNALANAIDSTLQSAKWVRAASRR